MKKLLISTVVLVMLVTFGLVGCETKQDLMVKFGIESLGMVMGREAARSGFVWNQDVEKYYNEVLTGKISVETFIQAQNYLSEELDMDPLIVNRMLALSSMMGAVIVDGQFTDVGDVKIEYIQWAFDGFRMGLAMR